jgi:hypothetical protein
VVDNRKPLGQQVSKRLRWSISDRVPEPLGWDIPADMQLDGYTAYEQKITMQLESTYTKYTITQPDWSAAG